MHNPYQAWRRWTPAERRGAILYLLALLGTFVPGAIAHMQHAATVSPYILH
jgi:hypothetical protein